MLPMVMVKTSYISVTEETLDDHTKFSNLDISTGREITYIINLDKKLPLISSY